MRTQRIATRQNMRQQNTALKKLLTDTNVVNRGLSKLDEALHKGYTMGFEAGVASVSKQEVPDASK